MIEDPLAEQMLRGSFKQGDIIKAVVKEGDIVFEKGTPPEEEAAPPTEEPAAVS